MTSRPIHLCPGCSGNLEIQFILFQGQDRSPLTYCRSVHHQWHPMLNVLCVCVCAVGYLDTSLHLTDQHLSQLPNQEPVTSNRLLGHGWLYFGTGELVSAKVLGHSFVGLFPLRETIHLPILSILLQFVFHLFVFVHGIK